MDKFPQIFTCHYDTKVGNNETFLPTFTSAQIQFCSCRDCYFVIKN